MADDFDRRDARGRGLRVGVPAARSPGEDAFDDDAGAAVRLDVSRGAVRGPSVTSAPSDEEVIAVGDLDDDPEMALSAALREDRTDAAYADFDEAIVVAQHVRVGREGGVARDEIPGNLVFPSDDADEILDAGDADLHEAEDADEVISFSGEAVSQTSAVQLLEHFLYVVTHTIGEDPLSLAPAQRILDASPMLRASVVMKASRQLCGVSDVAVGLVMHNALSRPERKALVALVGRCLKAQLPFGEPDLARMVEGVPELEAVDAFPVSGVLRAIDRNLEGVGPGPALTAGLSRLRDWLEAHGATKLRERTEELLARDDPRGALTVDGWGRAALAIADAVERTEAWMALFALARQGGRRTKPDARWLEAVQDHVQALGRDAFHNELDAMLDACAPETLAPANEPVVVGLVFMSVASADAAVARAAGQLAERALDAKPRRLRITNACAYALSAMPSPTARTRLETLEGRTDHKALKKRIRRLLG